MKESYLSYIYKDDGEPSIVLTDGQRQTISSVKKDVSTGRLRLIDNHCLCGSNHLDDDVFITHKDRYGLSVAQILCSKCGLVRSAQVFDDESNEVFYKEYYRSMYVAPCSVADFIGIHQRLKGEEFLDLLKKTISISEVDSVADVGCGGGGVLLPFRKEGMNCIGYDYNTPYFQEGLKLGLNLVEGDITQAKDEEFDLVILSHVMEHFLHPIEEMQRIIKKVKRGKYLLVQVPGIKNLDIPYQANPIRYFQNAHVYNFDEKYLRVFFAKIGLNVIYGDEKCTFLLQKTRESLEKVEFIYDDVLQNNAIDILQYLRKTYSKSNKSRFRKIVYKILCLFGYKQWRKYVKAS